MSLNLKLAALAAGLTLAPLAVAEELKFASFVPPFHTVTASLIEPLAEGISSGTDGSLTMRNYPGGELGAGPVEQYVRVVQGAADFAWGLPGYTSSQFKKTMIVELPGAIPGDMMGYEALWNAYESHLAGEFPATVPVALWTSEPNVFIMKEKVVRSPADVQGLKLRVAGATAGQVATAMGATPVQMPISQVYNALQTGLIDGVITGSSTLSDFKLDEVAASVTQGAPLGRLSFYAVMSEAAYNGLSDSERAAVDAASGYELSKSAEVAWNATAEAALAAAAASGENTMVQLTAAEAAAFTEVLADVLNAYVSDVGGAATMAAMNGN
ncbi:MAG: TRAP transporter substrate-binding protein [Alphaproteobacteria bacterium]|nr:TRAP transporter substrate-binding protein [Alphaproteobacteria bacterium]